MDHHEYTISGHICHYCGKYFTPYKKNIKYHLSTKYKCEYNTEYSYSESLLLSENKRFHFKESDFNSMSSYIDIVHNYTGDENYVQIGSESMATADSPLVISENDIENRKKKKGSEYDVFLNRSNMYECPQCGSEFVKVQNIKLHMDDKAKCEKRKKENEVLSYYKKIKDGTLMDISTQTDDLTPSGVEKRDMCVGTDDGVFYEAEDDQICENQILEHFMSKSYDYNIETFEDVKEYVYILQRASAVNTTMVKVGSTILNEPTRISKYEKGYKLLALKVVKNGRETERKLLEHFRYNFTQRKDQGNETFEGNVKKMEIAFMMIAYSA
jgi:hypothetical protein